MHCLKCPHCEKMYHHDKNYYEHLSLQDRIKRFKCGKCNDKFFTDKEVLKHRKLYGTKKWMLYTYVNYISHLVFICIQSSEMFKINRICVLFVLMTFLKRNKTYNFIFTWIHSKYVKCFLTSNETFSRKIGEVWKVTYICEDIFISCTQFDSTY